jgi:hypothetical protein
MGHANSKVAVVVFAILLAAGGVATADPTADASGSRERAASGDSPTDGFTLTVDPRMELLAVVQHFTSWAPGGHIKSKTAYKEDVETFFHAFRDHRAMAAVARLIEAGFTHDAPVAFMLYHGDPPELAQTSPYSDYLIDRAGSQDTLLELADALRDFARQTDFMRFYEAHRELYDTQLAEVASLIGGHDYVPALEEFYGESRLSYGVILSPLFAGGYGITIERDGDYDIYGVLGPCALTDTRVTFACLDYIESITLHEWSHSFVNPLVDANYDRFQDSAHLFEPIQPMMRHQAYPTWRICLYEHIVRACEIRLRTKLREDFNKGDFLTYQEGKGFRYISHIDSLLDVYDARREEYPTFGAFVPVIATRLAEISTDELPERLTAFQGPLDGIFPFADTIYIVYPTGVDDACAEGLEGELGGFSGFLSSAQIEPVLVSDEEALEIDWRDKIAFIYATPRQSPLLEKLNLGIPVAFAEDGLRFDGRVLEGEGLTLVSCLPNPQNSGLPFALVAANRPEDLIGASRRMGSRSGWNADYVIFRGDEVLETGRYRKGAGTWSVESEEPGGEGE